MTRDMSPRQRDVLMFINVFREREQRNPLFSEIAKHFEWRSQNSVFTHLFALKEKGAIECDSPEKMRAYRVTPPFMSLGLETQ